MSLKKLVWYALGMASLLEIIMLASIDNQLLKDTALHGRYFGPAGSVSVQLSSDLYSAMNWITVVTVVACLAIALVASYKDVLVALALSTFVIGGMLGNIIPSLQHDMWLACGCLAVFYLAIAYLRQHVGVYRRMPSNWELGLQDQPDKEDVRVYRR
jgi:hypothetical protein